MQIEVSIDEVATKLQSIFPHEWRICVQECVIEKMQRMIDDLSESLVVDK